MDADLWGGDGTVALGVFFRDKDRNQLMIIEARWGTESSLSRHRCGPRMCRMEPPAHTPDYRAAAKAIDHSLLRPDSTPDDVRSGCRLALDYDVASVCCRPTDVVLCANLLEGSEVAVGTVIGFPHGSSLTSTKAAETEALLGLGAVEFDMVVNIGWLRAGLLADVQADIGAVVRAAQGHVVKVILENAYLNDGQKVAGCWAAEAAGANYVKTSTGYGPSGATLADVALMRASVHRAMKVKCAGGVRTLDDLFAMRAAGADRSGATQTAAMLDEFRRRFGS
ncbi:MAG TPA: deoxyribose-phosphate aldolase [Acidimicrobiales bacterium]|nr:deoxyribose-phosphate aldolase [Acidimicrobiales bacterium]